MLLSCHTVWYDSCHVVIVGLIAYLTQQTMSLFLSPFPLYIKYRLHIYNVASQVALVVKNLPANAGDLRDEGSILGEGEMALHSSTLAWRIPWTEEPGGLQSIWFQPVGRK